MIKSQTQVTTAQNYSPGPEDKKTRTLGIIAQSALTRAALMDILSDWNPVAYQSAKDNPDLILIYHTTSFVEGFLKTPVPCPVLVLGNSHEEADVCLPVPCRLPVLNKTIERLLAVSQNAPVFENTLFKFNSKNRELIHKETDEVYHLTEKENALLTYLTEHLGESVSKETLLIDVWNYNPDVETHTVESHIYALRQKIGRDALDFLQNDDGGYFLVQE